MVNKEKGAKLSIIIVYYDSFKDLNKLFSSINKNKIRCKYEIILVDNSIDGEASKLLTKKPKNLIYIKSSSNLGYSKGNNIGAEKSKGEYLFILNPDTRIVSGSIDNLVQFLESHPKTGIIAPNLVDTNGIFFDKQGTRILTPLRAIFSLSLLSKILPYNYLLREYYMYYFPKNSFREVDVAPGSAFLIGKKLFKKVGMFDENFFLYFEEMDLCKRIRELNYQVYMTSDLVLEHDWRPESFDRKLKLEFAKSRYYYFKKHYGRLSAIGLEIILHMSKWNIALLFLLIILIWIGSN